VRNDFIFFRTHSWPRNREMKERMKGLLRHVPPWRPHEWWMWLYWIGAAAAGVKLGYDRWPWLSLSRKGTQINNKGAPLDKPPNQSVERRSGTS
jgi:hypothetical protein